MLGGHWSPGLCIRVLKNLIPLHYFISRDPLDKSNLPLLGYYGPKNFVCAINQSFFVLKKYFVLAIHRRRLKMIVDFTFTLNLFFVLVNII